MQNRVILTLIGLSDWKQITILFVFRLFYFIPPSSVELMLILL